MRKLSGIIRYTFTEIFRNRVYYVLILFGAVLVFSTLLFGALGGEQRQRMIVDMGLAGMELFALAIAVFAAVTLVLEEMESRTLYLILTRPVARAQFILGRFLGLIALITLAYGAMTFAHVLLCKLVHVPLDHRYALAIYFSWEKIVLITAVAMFFSLFATSTVSALTFTLFFWIMGHFSAELRYLAHRSHDPFILFISTIFYYIAPNFELMNLKDVPPLTHLGWLWPAAGYGFFYTASALALTMVIFRRKEF